MATNEDQARRIRFDVPGPQLLLYRRSQMVSPCFGVKVNPSGLSEKIATQRRPGVACRSTASPAGSFCEKVIFPSFVIVKSIAASLRTLATESFVVAEEVAIGWLVATVAEGMEGTFAAAGMRFGGVEGIGSYTTLKGD